MQGIFDALVTMDRNLPHQQNRTVQPFGIVLIEAPLNRMVRLRPLVFEILRALGDIEPGELRRVAA
jgi:hypothetical protein